MSGTAFLSELFFLIVLGLVAGSFSTMLVHRLPRGLSLFSLGKASGVDARFSSCPHCKTRLRALDLIPLFSWLFLRGCCRYCKTPISPVYLLVELSNAGLFVVIYFVFGLSWDFAAVYLVVPVLVSLFFIDMRHFILPNILMLCLFVLGGTHALLLYGLEIDQLLSVLRDSIIFAAVAYGLRFAAGKILKKEVLGLGDIKFFGAAGLWLGFASLPAFMILSGILGVIWGGIARAVFKQPVFPFGPSLIISFWILLFFLHTKGSLLL